jgi:uncharacterized protein YhaN
MSTTSSTRLRRGSVKKKSVQQAADSHSRVVAAARRAVRQAIKAHKNEGQPIIVWRAGRVVKVPAGDIKL